jgi:hypothetical protein
LIDLELTLSYFLTNLNLVTALSDYQLGGWLLQHENKLKILNACLPGFLLSSP